MAFFLFSVSPQILLSQVNQSVIDGDPVNFTCRATGVPTPKLIWTFVGGKLPLGINQNNFEGDSFVESVLEMRRATKKMDGTYKCTAENKANRTSYSTTLQVFGRSDNFNDYDGNNNNTDRDISIILAPSGARIFSIKKKKLFHLYMLTLEVGWPHLDMP